MLVHIHFHLFCRSKLDQSYLGRHIVKDDCNLYAFDSYVLGDIRDSLEAL